jgi:hypothetical protein
VKNVGTIERNNCRECGTQCEGRGNKIHKNAQAIGISNVSAGTEGMSGWRRGKTRDDISMLRTKDEDSE